MHLGFVALLDVLGFSSLVSGTGEVERLKRYQECLERAFDDEVYGPKVDYVVFSDSIVLTTVDDSEQSFKAIVRRCSRALGLMIEEEIPLRGAIAHGSFVRESGGGGVFVAGKAILEAYKYECLQDWVGVMLAPSARRRATDLTERCMIGDPHSAIAQEELRSRMDWAAFVQPCPRIPFHGSEENTYDGFAIVPTDGQADAVAIRDSLKNCLRKLNWLKAVAPDPLAQAKFTRTHMWLYQIQPQWHNVVFRAEQLGLQN